MLIVRELPVESFPFPVLNTFPPELVSKLLSFELDGIISVVGDGFSFLLAFEFLTWDGKVACFSRAAAELAEL